MAKTKKKKNYRLRKSVRRTLGALFMISAIIVAAIPFPDAAANNGEPGRQPQVTAEDDEAKLVYGGVDGNGTVEDEDLSEIVLSGDEEKAYKLVEIGGVLQYMWQYKYKYSNDLNGAVLTEYNVGYTVKNVVLDTYVNSANYLYVTQDKLNDNAKNFDAEAYILAVTYEDWEEKNNNYKAFSYYFAGDILTRFNKACQNYQDALNAATDENPLDSDEEDELKAAIETAGKGKYSSITDDTLRKAYYLEYIGEFQVKETDTTGTVKKLSRENFALTYALKPNEDNPNVAQGIYIVKRLNDSATIDGFQADSDGLMCNLLQDAPVLKGIGTNSQDEGAFSNVTTGVNLTLPDTLEFIADEAFMNSYVNAITIGGVKEIGNRAFKGSQLTTLSWSDSGNTEKIGAEAFAETFITDVSFPRYLKRIGNGAFANCLELENISIHDNSSKVEIGAYAFYNCLNLNSVDLENKYVSKIEEGAFSVKDSPIGSCTTFKFPKQGIAKTADLGDYVLAGRENLEYVLMPASLGYGSGAELEDNLFFNCRNLKCVEFPVTCREVTFSEKLFRNVITKDFYVRGPQFANNNQSSAGPRESTWDCKILDGSPVPYMYKDSNGNEFYEICEEDYIKLVDQQGILQSCEFVKTPTGTVPLTIAGTVGNKTIVGIADNCFSQEFLKHINSVTIDDDVAIKTIGKSAFANAKELKTVDIGNLVESIGDDAFSGCTALTKVTLGTGINAVGARAFKGCSSLTEIIFEQPVNRNELESFATAFPRSNIGTDAFALNEDENSGTKLTITGVIHPEYGPFVWAMEPDNFVNQKMGIRVCYKTGAPTYQTVILDNKNNLPTLVDYLHYSDLASIPATYEVIEYNNNVVAIDDADGNGDGTTGDSTGDNSGDNSDDTTNSSPTITTVNGWLKDKYEQYPEQLTAMENYTVDAAINLVIPAGIKSIDVKNFIKDSSEVTPDATYSNLKNSINVAAYMSNEEDNNLEDKVDSYTKYGLFNGDHESAITITEDGQTKTIGDTIGNDFIETVKMYTVEYLPNTDSFVYDDIFGDNGLAGGAFYECDNLQSVILGDEMQDIGELPFLGCNNLNSVACNSKNADGTLKYECSNKIIYENLDDGSNTKKIVQCLGSRGNDQDSKIDTTSDAYLSKVSTIADGAFADCSNLKVADFRGNSTLKEIPDKAFFNTDNLSRVELPENIRIIGAKAFSNIDGNPQIYVYGTEVSMAYDTFEKSNATVHTYEDTAAYNTAEKLLGSEGVEALPVGEPVYKVQFYDYDFKTAIGKEQQVKEGDVAIEPQRPTRTGYKFVGWSTNEWNTGVTKDLDVIAMYETDTTSGSGSGSGGSNGSGSGSSSGSNGSGSGGTSVNGGIDTDGDGIPDVDKDGNKLYKLTVTNGEGGGYYKAGQTVTIKAGNAPTGAGFAYWSCSDQDLIFEDHTDWITTLTMIASDVTVVCNFRGQYTLEVEYGSGSGSYPAGAKVAISAVEAPQGRKFASWKIKEGQPTVEDSKKETTFITMPSSNVKITATYMDTGSVSSNSTSSSKNNTSVIITKPGISDKDKASAYVSGSSDNFIVKISESLDAADEVQRALQNKYPDMSRIKYFAMDITLYDAKGENKITNTNGLKVNITMPIPDALKEYAGNNRVGAVVNGELESLNPKFTTIDGVPSITFTATHFSPYTIYVDTGNMTVSNTLDSTPKTGDIHPKWFLSLGLACISIILFTKRDRKYTVKA